MQDVGLWFCGDRWCRKCIAGCRFVESINMENVEHPDDADHAGATNTTCVACVAKWYVTQMLDLAKHDPIMIQAFTAACKFNGVSRGPSAYSGCSKAVITSMTTPRTKVVARAGSTKLLRIPHMCCSLSGVWLSVLRLVLSFCSSCRGSSGRAGALPLCDHTHKILHVQQDHAKA